MSAPRRPLQTSTFAAFAALALAALTAGCSSTETVPDPATVDKANKADIAKETKDVNKPSWVDSLKDKFNTTKVKSDNEADMYHFKGDSTTIFHKEPRSQQLLNNNKTLDPAIMEK